MNPVGDQLRNGKAALLDVDHVPELLNQAKSVHSASDGPFPITPVHDFSERGQVEMHHTPERLEPFLERDERTFKDIPSSYHQLRLRITP
jgi:predicted ester cyclase